ncbi:flavin reductase family protein [Tundrisphaera lichenicola]|uniref:flavin reductase family protein n=1 Tax=Tundrisphaera lichenicola TaxID=2029860 RepID=UPI003EB88FF5
MEIDPQALAFNLCYKLVIGCVVPRPIAVVSTVSVDGMPNVAPFSYFTVASHSPLSLAFTVGGLKGDGSIKDTLRNARFVEEGGVGEFVVNIADESYAEAMARTGESIPYGESEFHHAGLTPMPSQVIKPPRVGEASVSFECKTTHVIPIGIASMVIGEVKHIYVKDHLIDERYRIDADKLGAIGRMAGDDYVRTRDRFELRTAGR